MSPPALVAPRTGRIIELSGPRAVRVVEEPVPAPGPGQVGVVTRVSAISAGTELLVYRGELPEDAPLDEAIPALDGRFSWPVRYGYATVGTVVETGPGVERELIGRSVFAFQPHCERFVAPVGAVVPIPDELDAEAAVLLPSVETALGLVMDGRPLPGERVLVMGQGVIGLLTTAILATMPLSALVAVDPLVERRRRALEFGASAAVSPENGPALRRCLGARGDGPGHERKSARGSESVAPGDGAQGTLDASDLGDLDAVDAVDAVDRADLTFELTGNPAALDVAIRETGRDGRIVVGSWYGTRRATVDLGTHFHRGRLTVRSSQVSRIDPALRGRWTKARRLAFALDLIPRLRPERLVTHRFPVARAAEAFRLLDEAPEHTLQVLITYS